MFHDISDATRMLNQMHIEAMQKQIIAADANNARGWKHGNSKKNGKCNPGTKLTYSYVGPTLERNGKVKGLFRCRQTRKIVLLPLKIKY